MAHQNPYALTQVGQPRISGAEFYGVAPRKTVEAERSMRHDIARELTHLSIGQLEDVMDFVKRVGSEDLDG